MAEVIYFIHLKVLNDGITIFPRLIPCIRGAEFRVWTAETQDSEQPQIFIHN
jgi:hypothetical protein